MKHALMLTYDALPGAPPGAAVRTIGFAARLPDHGWSPSLLCARGGTPGPQLRRVAPPDALRASDQALAWAWAWCIRRAARAWTRERDFDLIYASCPPFPAAWTAVWLGRQIRRPVVLDFRDAWSLDPHATGSWLKRRLKAALARTLYRWIEGQCLAQADMLLTNTPSMDTAYAGLGVPEGRRLLLPNGFVEDHFLEEPPVRTGGAQQVVYCGRFRAVGGRNPWALLAGVAQLRAKGRDVELHVVGDEDPWLARRARELGLGEGLHTHPAVSPEESIRWMRRSDVIVVYQEPGQGPVTPIAGKTYEAIRAGRPILGLVPEGDNATLLHRDAARAEVISRPDPALVASGLARLLEDSGQDWPPSAEYCERHDRDQLTRRLAQTFDHILGLR